MQGEQQGLQTVKVFGGVCLRRVKVPAINQGRSSHCFCICTWPGTAQYTRTSPWWQPNCCHTTCNSTIAGCKSCDEASDEAMRVIAYPNHIPHGLFGLWDLIRLWKLSIQNMITATIILVPIILETKFCCISPVVTEIWYHCHPASILFQITICPNLF